MLLNVGIKNWPKFNPNLVGPKMDYRNDTKAHLSPGQIPTIRVL